MPDEKNRILLIEDNRAAAVGYADGLKMQFPSMEIDLARGLDKAEELLRANTYAAIVSDQNFPDLEADADEADKDESHGLKLMSRVRRGELGERNKPTLIVMHSSVMNDDFRNTAVDMGIDKCFWKGDFLTETLPYLAAEMSKRAIVPVVTGMVGGGNVAVGTPNP